jgi:hypothetical protein
MTNVPLMRTYRVLINLGITRNIWNTYKVTGGGDAVAEFSADLIVQTHFPGCLHAMGKADVARLYAPHHARCCSSPDVSEKIRTNVCTLVREPAKPY